MRVPIVRYWWYQPRWYKDYIIKIKKNVSVKKLIPSAGRWGSDPDSVRVAKRYAARMKKGDAFPAIEVIKATRKGKRRWRVTDGNHRALAWMLLKRKKLPIIIIVRDKRKTFEVF